MQKDMSKTEARKLSQVLFLIFIYKYYFHCQFTIFIPHRCTYQFCPPTPSYTTFPLMFESFTNRLIERGKARRSQILENSLNTGVVLSGGFLQGSLKRNGNIKHHFIYIHIYFNLCIPVLSKLNFTPWCVFHISTIVWLEIAS